jgi:hypothetical protein
MRLTSFSIGPLLKALMIWKSMPSELAQQPDFFREQFFFRKGQLLVIFPDEDLGDRAFNVSNFFQDFYIVDDDDFKVLHIVSGGCPTPCFQNLPQVLSGYRLFRIEGHPDRSPFPDER